MKDLISVIMPIFNTEEYIEKTLHSIVNQTYPNVEIILVNDASTDRTEEIAAAYAEKYHNIRLVNHKVNKGVSAARNLGLSLAKGDYITFVDSDDLLTMESIKILHNTAKENDADLVIGIYKNFNSESISMGSIYKRFKSLTQHGRVYPFANPEIFSHVYIFGKMYKKELLKSITFPEGIPYAEDQPFTMYTYLHAKRIFIAPSIVYYYREREKGESATQLAIKNPERYLQSTFDSFHIGRKYFEEKFVNKENYALLIYLSRVLQGSIRFIFEGAIALHDQEVLNKVIVMLINWVEKLDDYLVLGSDSFQTVFLEHGQMYMKNFDKENQMLYIQLLKLIRDKKLIGSQNYKDQTFEKNHLINLFLGSIDKCLLKRRVVFGKNYTICYPEVSKYDHHKQEAYIRFQLIKGNNTSLIEAKLTRENQNWMIENLEYLGNPIIKKAVVREKRLKILLTYRDFSGSNTLALYKQIPPYIKEQFDIDVVSGNHMSSEFVRKVMESDIIVTTNMEYGFHKFHHDPNKLVIDLWHGFPLKNMFYEDPNYRDKNSIASYWSQFDYLLSYSDLYSDVVNKCIKVNPNNYVITGAPRNDLLFVENSRQKLFDIIRKEDKGQKVIAFMPTFRATDQKKEFEEHDNLFGFTEFDFYQFVTFLENNNFELIIKAHPIFGRNFESLLEDCSCITLIDSNDLMNKCIDFYEVLGATDILITDYSSVYFDYLLLDKPIFFVPTDLAEYQVERGFVLDSYEKWTPGPKVIDQVNLQREILHYEKNSNNFKDKRNQIKDKVHYYKDKNSTERVWNFISRLGKD
jgi:CDP-glycerol glycerophosphotransferase (TagB/SpsB family)/glycosyltransferase involved in cell wall biosynthesis